MITVIEAIMIRITALVRPSRVVNGPNPYPSGGGPAGYPPPPDPVRNVGAWTDEDVAVEQLAIAQAVFDNPSLGGLFAAARILEQSGDRSSDPSEQPIRMIKK